MNINKFVTQFSENINFEYSCFDRIQIKGYIRKLFCIGALVKFLRALGFNKLSKGVMRILTDQLNEHIEKQAKKHNIPIIHWQKVKQKSKLQYVQKNFVSKSKCKANEVFCIITAQENVLTFGSKELISKNGKKYWKIYKCKKRIKHYYIYMYDETLGGPSYLKISSYLPFNCAFYFNGHNAIKVELSKRNIKYKMKDNAFTYVEDPEILTEIVQSLDGKKVLDRISYWMNCFFKFDKGKYSTRSKYLKHEWYFSQVEISSNVIFKSARFCTNIFERLLDKFSRFGLPERISMIFNKRPRRHDAKSTWKTYNNNVCMRHWFDSNSVKIYNKSGNFIRVETTINNPKLLGYELKKSVIYMQSYFWVGLRCNMRFYDCCADIDKSSIAHCETEKFTKAVLNKNGKKIAAPDLRKDRQSALFKELIKPKYIAHGFKTSDLKTVLSVCFENSAQIRYELQKLITRKMVIKFKSSNFYRVTLEGWKWMWIQICSIMHFQNPVIARTLKEQVIDACTQPSKIEEAYSMIDQGLKLFTREVGLAS